jgi:phosphotransferase system  glucose/maltose/N-acetylglucosamine-specific IIC component
MRKKFEKKHEPLLSRQLFLVRLVRHVVLAFLFILVSLGIGMTGYRCYEGMPWVDAFLNASMILGGMGPVGELHTEGGKIFAGCYALYSGLMAIVIVGIMAAPILHRFLHRFNLESE